MKLSIVIPVYNKYNFTKSCLMDLSNLSQDHEIIIVDNGSKDETSLLQDVKTIKYIRNSENLGFAKACNIGYRNSTSDKVLFLNNDIRVKSNHTNWTDALIDAMDDDSLVGPTAGYVNPYNNFSFMYETSDLTKKINYISGWCLGAKKSVFEKLSIKDQIFSEEFGLAYFEDTDLGFRASELGIKFKLINIPVTHFGKISSGQINTSALYSSARKIFIKKWSKS